jgi:glc operon protein GlcG
MIRTLCVPRHAIDPANKINRGRTNMRRFTTMIAAIALAAPLFGHSAAAQPSPTPALDVIPDVMPFNVPYGTPITLERAQKVVAAALAEAEKRHWNMNVSVVDPNGDLIAFGRMDSAQLASIEISQHKARTAARFRRNTKLFENGIQGGLTYQLSLDGVIGSRGGIPLIEGGKIIGAIGVSGGAGSQDEVCATAGAAVINK